jgi:hypothetical protein
MTCGPWITATILATLFTYGVSTWAMSSFLLDYINNRTNGPRLSSTVTFVEVVPRARSASYNVKRTLCIIMTRQLFAPPGKETCGYPIPPSHQGKASGSWINLSSVHRYSTVANCGTSFRAMWEAVVDSSKVR